MEAVTNESMNEARYASPSQHKPVWRIGSISMGVTLIGIGLSFATSLWQDSSAYELLLWLAPLVFIMLGAELLIMLKVNRSERYHVKYDWLSLWFVAIIGAGAMFMSILFYTGITEQINQALNMKERTLYIDEQAPQPIDANVNKIVIKSALGVEIAEHESLSELYLTGMIEYEAKEALAIRDQQLMNTKKIGDVLYVFINNIERDSGVFVNNWVSTSLVLSVPAGVTIEQ